MQNTFTLLDSLLLSSSMGAPRPVLSSLPLEIPLFPFSPSPLLSLSVSCTLSFARWLFVFWFFGVERKWSASLERFTITRIEKNTRTCFLQGWMGSPLSREKSSAVPTWKREKLYSKNSLRNFNHARSVIFTNYFSKKKKNPNREENRREICNSLREKYTRWIVITKRNNKFHSTYDSFRELAGRGKKATEIGR